MDDTYKHKHYVTRTYLAALLTTIICAQVNSTCAAGEQATESEKCLVDIAAVPDSLGGLYVAKCFGKEYKVFIDTGASCSIFDESLRRYLGDPVMEARTNLGTTAAVFAAPKIEIGGVLLDGKHSVSADLTVISDAVGHDVTGVIGMDAISRYVVEMDLAGERMRLYRSVPTRTIEMAERLRMKSIEGGVWTISASLPDGDEEFLLDTGSDGAVVLAHRRFKQLRVAKSIRNCVNGQVFSLLGEEKSVRGELVRIRLGTHEHLGISVSSKRSSALGRSYLRRFVVTFDFQGGYLYLIPSKDYDAGDPREDRSGIRVMSWRDLFIIRAVEKDSAAYNAGLRPGDRILRIHGRRTEGLPEGRLRSILSGDGERVEVIAVREGKEFVTEFRLRDCRQRTARSSTEGD